MKSFEDFMKAELSVIEELKVLPIVVREGTKSPYLTYRNEYFRYKKTLQGISNTIESGYELIFEAKTYDQLSSVYESISNVLKGFLGKYIANANSLIQDCTFECIGDSYDSNVDMFVRVIKIQVVY